MENSVWWKVLLELWNRFFIEEEYHKWNNHVNFIFTREVHCIFWSFWQCRCSSLSSNYWLKIIFWKPNSLIGCLFSSSDSWLDCFSSMGRIEIRNSEIVVDRNFKRYRLDPFTIVVRLGEKNTSRDHQLSNLCGRKSHRQWDFWSFSYT